MRTTKTLWLAAALAVAGCRDGETGGDGDDNDTEAGPGINLDDTADDQGEEEDIGADESSSDDGGPLGTLECERIDFLFVIDNSSSMADEQQHLVDAVPGFVSAMQTALPDVKDLRVGVVDTDSYPGLGNPDPLDACTLGDECASCDYTLGALLTKPESALDSETTCDFSSGAAYMDGLSEGFAAEFECAAIVGTEGNPVEQQAGALVNAVSAEMNEGEACNESFVRDDALLVFLVISDEEDDVNSPPAPQGGSIGDPDLWYDAIVEAKGGIETNAVALGLIGGSPRFGDCTDLSQGLDGAEQTTRLQQFIGKFENNFTGSVCSEGYDAFFQQALEEVSEGCRFFIP